MQIRKGTEVQTLGGPRGRGPGGCPPVAACGPLIDIYSSSNSYGFIRIYTDFTWYIRTYGHYAPLYGSTI